MDHNLKNVLAVNVFDYLNQENLSISVLGAIEEPGFYDLEKYDNLNTLIEDLSFVDVYPWLGVLEQFDNNNLIKSTVLFSLNDKSTYQSIELLPNSKIFFANIDEREFEVGPMAQNKIDEFSLLLNFKNETFQLPVIGRFSVKSFIDLLGLDMTDVDQEATYVNPLDSNIVVDNFQNMNFIAKKYHNISFRSQINDLISVTISGAIDYPGTYTLKSDSTLEELYKLVGDFKEEAFLDGVILTREAIRTRQQKAIDSANAALNKSLMTSIQSDDDIGDISLLTSLAKSIEPDSLGRIAGDFSPLSPSAGKTVLFDGDEIIIPKFSNVINIIGEVLNPIAFEYSERMTLNSAITKAGGLHSYADRKRIYIIKANGMIQKPGRNVFATGSQLEPGDTIVIPRKVNIENRALMSLMPITQILSDLAFSAAAIDNLSNN